jgi:hypothetical protein
VSGERRKPGELLGSIFVHVPELPLKPIPEVFTQQAPSVGCYRPLGPLRAVPCPALPCRAAPRRDISSMLLSGDFPAADGESLPTGGSAAVGSVFWLHTRSTASCQCLPTQKDKIQNVLGL